ncbi:transcriptional regulator [Actinacidiphila bryophytorum]|uniref:transcriptional regulator n=1 Tax=Actinacidiphila bryophytorum TaxID=1436133 RepID=UPI002176E338|nr:transcriptional regulator [Actinacidiphila bryophytorum]UWE10764.1 transcriptional regulator [Actinacidiphila bryophytorum]
MSPAAAHSPVSPMLSRLAQERATGVLVRDTGALYLADGEVVHAESPAAPGIEVLLTAGGRLSPEAFQEAVAAAGAECATGRWLVEHRRLAAGELEISRLGALHDAAYFVLSPGAGGQSRFRHGVRHWFGSPGGVPVAAVEGEARRRRLLLESLWPHPRLDAAPVTAARAALRPGARPFLPRRQAALLGLADGVRTPSAIAALLGRPAFHALVDVRRLAALGLVETPRGSARTPGRAPAWFQNIGDDPDAALLRRLRVALERL